jgi:hypothetical protein
MKRMQKKARRSLQNNKKIYFMIHNLRPDHNKYLSNTDLRKVSKLIPYKKMKIRALNH